MRRRSLHAFKVEPRRQRGAVLILVMVAMAAILMMSALALDGGHMLMNKARLQNAVDAAALSGAKTLSQLKGAENASTLTRTAVLRTLMLNAGAAGNDELESAIGGKPESFAVVELSNSVYGPFSFPGPTDASYVRVLVPNYRLSGFFWSFVQSFGSGNLGGKSVAAIATAGPSPTSPCDIAPLMACGDPDPDQYNPSVGKFWGYGFGDLEVLKIAGGNSSPVGSGNFQVIRLPGSVGADDVREALAGGAEQCYGINENIPVETEPGNMVGPVEQGLNTRFGQSSTPDTPPDLVITANDPPLTYNDELATPRIEHDGLPVDSTNGHLTTKSTDSSTGTITTRDLFDYLDWKEDSAACIAGTGKNCEAGGVFERRMLKIVVGNCNGASNGQTSVPVLGFGCFFVLQPVVKKGNEAQIFGQFVKACEGDGVAGPTPATDAGPQIIQLYKTYIDNSRTPSKDS